MKTTIILSALLLSACSSAVHITDDEHDMLIGTDRTQKGCSVRVDEDFTGTVEYDSNSCKVSIIK